MYKILMISWLIHSSLCLFSQSELPYNVTNNDFKLSRLYPEGNVNEIGKYEKLEFGIRIKENINQQINEFLTNTKVGLNPYDPEEISVEVTFISPTAKQQTVYGFYYQEYERGSEKWMMKKTDFNWRVRFAPNELGEWKFSLKIKVKNTDFAEYNSNFKCVVSKKKGVIQRNYEGDESDRYLMLSETKKTFFTIGHNIAHSAYYQLTPKKAELHQQWLTELADNGGNFFRLELGAQNGLPDWNNHKDYTSKMPQMWEYDKLIEHAENLGLYFIMFRHHTEVTEGESWDVARWENNPYKKGFDLVDRLSYFQDEDVLKSQKNALRYIFSRWGYSTSFAFYEYQEIDNWYKDLMKETEVNEKEAIHIVTDWYLKHKKYIKNELGYNKLFINTYATTPDYEYSKNSKGLFANSDVIGFHKYGQDKSINIDYRGEKSEELFDTWNKPLFVEEMGVNAGGNSDFLPIYKCDKSEFHNAIWSTSFMGLAGTGMTWWWDRGIHEFGYYKDYKAIQFFFKNEDLINGGYVPQKWHNKLSINRTTIENFALKNKEETKVLGWVHNASSYWRNINSDCLNDLIDDGVFDAPYQLEDGVYLGKENNGTDFSKRGDAYTDKGGVQNIDSETFDIKGLKTGGVFGKKKWYEITFYSTNSNKEVVVEKLKTNVWGKLKPKFPEGTAVDYSYKVIFLGEGKKAP